MATAQPIPDSTTSPAPERTLVVLATYNEAENLEELVREVLAVAPTADVLVIDDSSPDGTGQIADRLAAENPRVHSVHRPGKLGLGTATVQAMRYAIEHGYELVLTMDADFSHSPRHIPDLLRGMSSYDVMIGSRYMPGGGVRGWPLRRRLMSKAINAYARLLLGLPARDTSGAFRCYRTSCLKQIDFDRILSRGYSFQEEFLYRCLRVGCRIGEWPIVFEERRRGRSKINPAEALAALWIIFRLGLCRLVGRPTFKRLARE